MIVIFDTHPVQYRGPLFKRISALCPGGLIVAYGSVCSLRGYFDSEFGKTIAWDVDLMQGYHWIDLSCGTKSRSLCRQSIDIVQLIINRRPDAALFVHFNSLGQRAAYLVCLLLGVPIWLRTETQDQAFDRGPLKAWVRRSIWTIIYRTVARAFYIGELNRKHLLSHGIAAATLSASRYCVADGVRRLPLNEKIGLRNRMRAELGLKEEDLVIGFCGKLIAKKNPLLLLEAFELVRTKCESSCRLVFIGSGELEEHLRHRSEAISAEVKFVGFVNQEALPMHYLAFDVFVLPSKREGETWGLVVNEALQAGCAVAVSSAVGCAEDFGGWERCRVFEDGHFFVIADPPAGFG